MVTNLEQTIGKIYEEGLIAGKMEAAKKMLIKNIPEDLIIEVTGLPIEQIKKIKSELH